MKVLVTGAKGMLGQDLCPIFEDAGYEVIETDADNLDITDAALVKQTILEQQPDIVVHCAAYTNVDKAEDEIDKAELINIKGTENVAIACKAINAIIVYISTDYVFDGNKDTPYEPEDKVNPINNYGLTKLKGEEAVQKHCQKFYIVRTSWLYGHHGNNFVETMLELQDKDALKVVNDQTGCPTWTVELANGILSILNKPYGIYHICGSGNTTWYEFAKEILGSRPNLIPCTTEEYPRPAKRPKYSVMNNNRILRHWKDALKDYLELRIEE